MANVKVNIKHPDVSDVKGNNLPLGENSIDEKLAEKLVSRNLAEYPAGKKEEPSKKG